MDLWTSKLYCLFLPFPVSFFLCISGFQQEVPCRGHLALSGDIFGSHNWLVVVGWMLLASQNRGKGC